jgi:hypothetical protein
MAVRAVEVSIDGAEFFDFVLNDVVSLHGYVFLISAYSGLAAQHESLP